MLFIDLLFNFNNCRIAPLIKAIHVKMWAREAELQRHSLEDRHDAVRPEINEQIDISETNHLVGYGGGKINLRSQSKNQRIKEICR